MIVALPDPAARDPGQGDPAPEAPVAAVVPGPLQHLLQPVLVRWPERSFLTALGLDLDPVLALDDAEIAPTLMTAEAHPQEMEAKTVISEARVSPTTLEVVLLLWELARQPETETGAGIVVM